MVLEKAGAKAAAAMSILTLLAAIYGALTWQFAKAADLQSLAEVVKAAQIEDYADRLDSLDLEIAELKVRQNKGSITDSELLRLEVLMQRRARYEQVLVDLRKNR